MQMYDIHCHLLPGLDDGAFAEDETLKMAEIAVQGRTQGIVCTPHVQCQAPSSVRDLLYAFHQICVRLKESGISLQLFLGQEIFVDDSYRSLPSLLKRKQLLTINHSVYPLVEFDPRSSEISVLKKLALLKENGYTPIAAHPERYAFLQRDLSAADRLHECGALLRIDKDSIAGAFGSSAARTADALLREQKADFAASDVHSPYQRTPSLRHLNAHISERYTIEYADFLLFTNPRKVLKNETIHPFR
jgi:protein-tyrosine phosphatase